MSAASTPVSDIERQALAGLRRMRERLDAIESARHEPLAIVGAACRFPAAPDIDAFWELLLRGGDGIVDIPPERWDGAALARAAAAAGARLPAKAGLLDRIDGFDAEFFGIAAREAQLIDPQQRMFLEVAWEALERAGIPPLALKGSSTGVFVGTTTSDYLGLLGKRLPLQEMDAYIVSGNTINATAGRVSYTLGLHGPAMAIDTACSSSLVAIDRACRSVREGESRLAIAGGVNLVLAPEVMMALSRWGMLAPDGHCKTFDAAADGFVRAEGCGVVLIKRLSDALADGDRIWALVRGSAVNQAGASGAFAVPNGLAQSEVMRSAVAAARIDPAELGFLEAHGTGTSLGDPIEMEGIASVYGAGRAADRALWVGAVKSNVGHLEAAAGVTGLIKTVLALQHRRIPPNLHFVQPSPHIPWESMPVRVPTRVEEFPLLGARRLAAVSAFGFSGTNAHVVLEEAPAPAETAGTTSPPGLLLTISARSEPALRELAERHAQRIESLGAAPQGIGSYCLAAAAARSHLPLRMAVSGRDAGELAHRLRAAASNETGPGVARGRVDADRAGVAFFFTGQGAQWRGMGRQLAQASPVFRAALERVAALVDPLLGRALLPVIFGEAGDEADASLDRTAVTQPALFAIEVALVEWWRSVGIVPSVVLGHSVGEFAAAWTAGVLSLEDAATLVTLRGALMESLPEGGAMCAVMADEAAVQQRISALGENSRPLVVAGVNGPSETVVSGAAAAVHRLAASFESDGVRVDRLSVSHAFHSPLMEPMLRTFAEAAQRVQRHAPRIPVISSMTGAVADEHWGSPQYWLAQVCAPVRWFDAMRSASATAGIGLALEIGPQPVLTGLGRRNLPDAGLTWLPSLRRGQDDVATALASLGELYVRGAVEDWSGAAGAAARGRIDLPTYPFQRRRYWPDGRAVAAPEDGVPSVSTDASWLHPLLGARLPLAGSATYFQGNAGDARHAWVRDHRIGHTGVWPATASLEMLLAAAWQVRDGRESPTASGLEVRDLELPTALRLPADRGVIVQTVLQAAGADGRRHATLCHAPDSVQDGDEWPVFARASIGEVASAGDAVGATDSLPSARAACREERSADELHERLAQCGANFGPAFRRLSDLRRGSDQALALLLPLDGPPDAGHAGWLLHPSLLDAALQLVSAADDPPQGDSGLWVPMRIDRVVLHPSAKPAPARRLWGHARLHPRGGRLRTLVADIHLWHEDGAWLATLQGVSFTRAAATDLDGSGQRLWQDALRWTWEPFEREPSEPAAAASQWRLVGAAAADGFAAALDRSLQPGRSTTASPGDAAAQHVVCMAALAQPPLDAADGPSVVASASALFDAALAALRACDAPDAQGRSPRLWLITRGAQAIGGGERPDPRAAALWGLARVVRAERSESLCTIVDIDADTSVEALAALLQHAAARGLRETQLALRGGRWWRARLAPWRRHHGGDFRFVPPASGRIDDLAPQALDVPLPGPGEVCIDVRAAGLNFRDVLATLGMVPSPVAALGGECAGRVRAVGPGVEGFAAGDEVMALALGGMASRVCVLQQYVAPRPAALGAVEAAALPIACLTASYAFEELAGLRAGQRVLIHAATGGVGMAAVMLAMTLGAEVLATAGSEAKRALLKQMGVRHVFDSRSLAFADGVRACTGGQGVDVVLNALAGEFIEAGLDVLAPGGCFLEMGKRDVWTPQRVAERFPGLRYHVFDLGEAAAADATLAPRLFDRLGARLARGELQPLPVAAWPMGEARAAFQTMAQARHVGKLVLVRDASAAPLPVELDARAGYLITGGFGALGLHVAEALLERGARHLVLLGRRAPSAAAEATLQRLADRGAMLHRVFVDVADAGALRAAFDALGAAGQLPPLRGIVHAAGLVDDAVLAGQDGRKLAHVMAPKVAGAINLAAVTAGMPLDFFVAFSAGAAWLGHAGQANYAAANTALEAVAQSLRAQGRPATAIAWGRWAGAGMADGAADWQALGIGEIAVADGTAALFDLVSRQPGTVGLMPMDWGRYLGKAYGGQAPACFDLLSAGGASGHDADAARAAGAPDALTRLQALPAQQRRDALQGLLADQVRRVAGLDAELEIDPARPLRDLGLDSLMSVDLRNALVAVTGRSLPATLVFDHPTLDALTDQLMRALPGLQATAPVQAPAPKARSTATLPASASAAEVTSLSDEEAEAQLLAELRGGDPR